MSVTNIDLLNQLKLLEAKYADFETRSDERLTKLNKYYIGKLVSFEKEHNTIIEESKLLKHEVENLNKKYYNVCEEMNVTRNELNTLKDKINKSNIHLPTHVENIEPINQSTEETNTNFDKITISTTVTEILNLHGVCDDIITVKKELNELKQQHICDDIVITGIPETKNENLLEIVNSLLVQYEIVIKSTDLKSIFRLKNMKCGVNSPILLVLKNEKVKCEIMEKQKHSGPIIIHQNIETASTNPLKVFFKHRLTLENLHLLRNVRKFCRENSYRFVWTTNDAKILIKKSSESRTIKILSLKDLELLKT